MELARNLAVQNKKQPLETCVVLIAVGFRANRALIELVHTCPAAIARDQVF